MNDHPLACGDVLAADLAAFAAPSIIAGFEALLAEVAE